MSVNTHGRVKLALQQPLELASYKKAVPGKTIGIMISIMYVCAQTKYFLIGLSRNNDFDRS